MTSINEDPQILQDRLTQFMDEHIYPNEDRYHAQLHALADRFSTVPLMEAASVASSRRTSRHKTNPSAATKSSTMPIMMSFVSFMERAERRRAGGD